MAGLMSRFTTLFKVKANKALDKAENPSETLDYSYQKQLESLQKVKRGVADVVDCEEAASAPDGKARGECGQARRPGQAGAGGKP